MHSFDTGRTKGVVYYCGFWKALLLSGGAEYTCVFYRGAWWFTIKDELAWPISPGSRLGLALYGVFDV